MSNPADDDPDLRELHDAWSYLPLHKKSRIMGIVRGVEREKQCPMCGRGQTRVRSGRTGKTLHVQTVECTRCGHSYKRSVAVEDVRHRNREPKPRA